jgi:hypothetical protein
LIFSSIQNYRESHNLLFFFSKHHGWKERKKSFIELDVIAHHSYSGDRNWRIMAQGQIRQEANKTPCSQIKWGVVVYTYNLSFAVDIGRKTWYEANQGKNKRHYLKNKAKMAGGYSLCGRTPVFQEQGPEFSVFVFCQKQK